MKAYQEITLLPDADISISFIWQNVFQQVHIALVENKVAENRSHIAVSFPQYGNNGFPLGNKMRLFAQNKETLEKLNITSWLERLLDYVHIKGIQEVPTDCAYVCFSRKRVKTFLQIERDMHKKAQLWANKADLSYEECLESLAQTKPEAYCDLPFIYLHSQQTKKRSPESSSKFPLFINMEKLENAGSNEFDCYGLSTGKKQSGVPYF